MDFTRFSAMAARAEDAFDTGNPEEIPWLYVYGLYSLVDATSQIEGAIEEHTSLLRKIEGHLHHISMESFKQ